MLYRVFCVKTGQRFQFFSTERMKTGQRIAFVPDDGGNFIVEVESNDYPKVLPLFRVPLRIVSDLSAR